ncbi:GNAT family N-acetyltransferase [Marinimicrobium sp. ARAG 43.8]|uniref:GNAT family N-acetyltransferase n=1 Tax=Marinimicrobium sp. ARAG 43.8 TaxID=3418719 RepID=UPI003CF48068
MKDEISFKGVHPYEVDDAYDLYKQCLFGFIDQTFGWDEAFQRDRFRSSYSLETLFWLNDGSGRRIGLACFSKLEVALHLSLFLLYKSFQGAGLGSQIMEKLERSAGLDAKVTLSTFKVNKRAISFYQKLGYRIDGQDENFYEMKKTFVLFIIIR